MAMNFFESQDRARKRTGWLVWLFLVAVICIVLAIYAVVSGLMMKAGTYDTNHIVINRRSFWDAELFLIVAPITILVIAAGSIFKILELRSGGAYVAQSLGGKRLSPDTTALHERRVLNVVEEMAIASGVSVPPVFLMDREMGINAFAAGYTPNDAVIGVSRGCIERLSRDELQGVIAHEFSHILNGDMKLNIRLIGILHGILIIGILGYFVLRSAIYSGAYHRSSRDRGNPLPLLAIGVSLMVIGYVGTFFGNWIKAAVSRQREYLADASAVQFTRNPDGIAGALKKIGGFTTGSRIESPNAPQLSHMFFSKALSGGLNFMFSTHPPLPDRITRIDPGWDGKFVKTEAPKKSADTTVSSGRAPLTKKAALEMVAGAAMAASAIEQSGQISPQHIQHAHEIVEDLPEDLKLAAHEPYSARAVIYCLLLNRDSATEKIQLARLKQHSEPGMDTLVDRLGPRIAKLKTELRLPLMDIAMPALKSLSGSQYRSFRENLGELVMADARISLFEWCLKRIVVLHLDEQFGFSSPTRVKYYGLARLAPQCEVLLSMLAYAGHDEIGEAKKAFEAGTKHLGMSSMKMMSAGQCELEALDLALVELSAVSPKLKRNLMLACAACIAADQEITTEEAELFRAFGESLDVPVPPLLAGQSLG